MNPSDLTHQKDAESSTAFAILKKKPSPHKLVVDDSSSDDNSVITMHTSTLETLGLFVRLLLHVNGREATRFL